MLCLLVGFFLGYSANWEPLKNLSRNFNFAFLLLSLALLFRPADAYLSKEDGSFGILGDGI